MTVTHVCNADDIHSHYYYSVNAHAIVTMCACPCRYGFSRARYVYSLISGVGIFFLGSGVTIYHGIHGLIHPPAIQFLPAVSTTCTCITSHYTLLIGINTCVCWWVGEWVHVHVCIYIVDQEIFDGKIFTQLNFCVVFLSLLLPLNEINLLHLLIEDNIPFLDFIVTDIL